MGGLTSWIFILDFDPIHLSGELKYSVKTNWNKDLGLGDTSIFEIYRYLFKQDMERDAIVNINIVNLS